MVDPSEEIIPQGVVLDKKPGLDGEAWRRSQTSISAAVSKVLDNDDLLIEILLRVCFPTTFVCAAAVCRRWLHHASDGAFLRHFRELHPPRLLGLYINPLRPRTTPRFIPMLPQPPELATVIRQASSSLDTCQNDSAPIYIIDCRNGSMLLHRHVDESRYTVGVHNLLCPQRGMTIVPQVPLPRTQHGSFYTCQQILAKEKEDGRVCYLYVLMQYTRERENVAQVYMLQDGVWCMHAFTIDRIPYARPELKSVLVENKIYMLVAKRDIIGLDLTASSFATIQLPQGVEYEYGKTMLSPAGNATGVYLIHVKELQLSVWVHNRNGWLLAETTICLREMCASLSMLDSNASLQLKHVDDNAEFVYLKMGRCILCLNVKCRTMRKVYELTKEDRWLGNIFPFMMIWPPMFPVLKDDLARNAM